MKEIFYNLVILIMEWYGQTNSEFKQTALAEDDTITNKNNVRLFTNYTQ